MQIKGSRYLFYSLRFWQFFAIMILGNYFSAFFSYSYKPYGENDSPHDQISDKTLTWAASVGAGLINGLSRIFFGWLIDKFSFRRILSILMLIELVNSMVCFWAAYYPALYFVCILVNYACVGGMFTIFPVSVTNVFGLEHGPAIYVQVMFGGFITSILNLMTTMWLLPVTNFMTLFYVGSLTQIATLALLWWFKEELDVDRLSKYNAVEPISSKK